MKYELTLVQLSIDQIARAKEKNGPRKLITHGLICGPYGQIFGTEKHCRRYYSSWSKIFPHLFIRGVEVNKYEITEYESTFNLVNILIELHEPLEKSYKLSLIERPRKEKIKRKGNLISNLLARFIGS